MDTPVSEASPVFILPLDVARDVSMIQEDFPDIAEKITRLWGSSELNQFFDSLMFDERGTRQGFPGAVFSALMRISKTHILLVPTTPNDSLLDHLLKER